MGFMDNLMSASATKFGKAGCYVAPEFEKHLCGMELPHLALQRLFGSNIFQLHTIMELAGPKGSGKSSFAFFILALFLVQDYYGVLIETENKLSPSLLLSILGPKLFERLVIWEKCTKQEMWQDKMTLTIKEYAKAYNKSLTAHNEALRRIAKCTRQASKDKIVVPPVEPPLLIVLDSLGGPPAEASLAAIQADGHASKSYPAEALNNSKYFSNLPELIRDIPITILYTNHKMLDLGADDYGEKDKSKGGATPAFFCSHRLFFDEMSAVSNPRIGHYEQHLKFKCVKNSLNQRGPMMRLLMEWDKWVEEDDEKQSTRFGWPELLIQILAPDGGKYAYDREKVKEFLTVTFRTKVKYDCPELGLKDASPREVGEAIEKDPVKSRQVAPFIGVKKWQVFDVNKPPVGRFDEKAVKKEKKKDAKPK